MTWGINFNANIDLLRISFNNLNEVESHIDENESLINSLQTEIKMFAASNPKDIVPNEWNEQPIDWINNQISEKLSLINEYNIENFKLYCYIEYLKEQNLSKEEDIN